MSIRTHHDLGYRGTPPRASTRRALAAQLKAGLPFCGKRVLLPDGRVVHPTKGPRCAGIAESRFIPVPYTEKKGD